MKRIVERCGTCQYYLDGFCFPHNKEVEIDQKPCEIYEPKETSK